MSDFERPDDVTPEVWQSFRDDIEQIKSEGIRSPRTAQPVGEVVLRVIVPTADERQWLAFKGIEW